jgi:hypothetical protein
MRSVFVAALAASASALKTKEALPWFDAIETGVKVGLHQGAQNTWDVAAHTTETFADGVGSETQTQSNDSNLVLTTTPVESDLEGSTILLEAKGAEGQDFNCDFAFTQDFQGHITHVHADASAEKAECVKSKTALANLFESHASEEGELEFTKHAPWSNGRLAQVDYKMNVQSDGKMTIGHKATQGNSDFEVGAGSGFNVGGGSETSTSTYAADGSLNEVDVSVTAIAGASSNGGTGDVQLAEKKAFVQVGELPTGDGGATPQIIQANSQVVMAQSGTSSDVEIAEMPANVETRKYTAPHTFFDAENAHDTSRDDVTYEEYSKDIEKSFGHFEKLAESDPKSVASYIAKDLAVNKRSTKTLNMAISALGKCGAHGQETLVSLVQGSNEEQKTVAFSALHELNAPTEKTLDALFAISEGKTADACAADLALGAMASKFDKEDKIAKRLYANYESAKAFGKKNSCGLMGVSNAEFHDVEIFDDIKEAIKSAKVEGKLQETIMLYDALRMSTVPGVDAYLNAEFQAIDQSHHALLAPLMDIMSKRNGKEAEKSIDTLKSLVESGAVTNSYVQKKMVQSFKKRSTSHLSPASSALLETINAQEGWNNVQEGESDEVMTAHCASSTKASFYADGANFSGENGRVTGHEDDEWVRKLPQSSPLYNVKTASAIGKHMKYGYEVYGGIQAGMDLSTCQLWASAGGGLQIFFMETDSSGNDTDGFEFTKTLVEGFAGAQFSDSTFSACAYMKYFMISVSAKKVTTDDSDRNGVVCNDGWTASTCNCKGNTKQSNDFSGCCSWHDGIDAGATCKKFKFSGSQGDKWLLSPQTLGPLTIACGTSSGCNQCTGVQGTPPQVTQNNSGTKTLIQAAFTFTFWGLVSITITVKITSYFYTQYGYSLITGTSNGTPLGSGCGYPAAYAYFKPGVVLTFTIIADVGIACPSGYKDPLPSSGYLCTASIGFGGDVEIVDFGTPLTATVNGWTSGGYKTCMGIQATADFFAGRLFVRYVIICAKICICVNKPWGRRRRRRRSCGCTGGCTKGPTEDNVATWTAPATWTATIAQSLCCDSSNRRRRGVPGVPTANDNPAQRRRRRRRYSDTRRRRSCRRRACRAD